MPMNREQAVAQLLDKDEIWQCMLRYSRGLDRLDLDLLRSAYWDDARSLHGTSDGSVEDFLAFWLPAQSGREVVQHTMTNFSVRFDGEDAADSETYFVAYLKSLGDDRLEMLGGRYVDRFERRSGEWRILTRLLVFDWQATADASGMTERLAVNHRGSRDRSDPSYESPVRPNRHPAGS